MLGAAAVKSPAFQVEVAVIGAGAIGLAIARSLAMAGKEVMILERASAIATETSSRNSEVIHAGLYYPSSSLKAKFCVEGKLKLYDYCQSRYIPYNACGKLLVATDGNQLKTILPDLQSKAIQNGVNDIQLLSSQDVQYLEPDIQCLGALLSPSTGVLDSHSYYLALLADAEEHGTTLVLQSTIEQARIIDNGKNIQLQVDGEWIQCQTVINSAGLNAGHVATMFHKDIINPAFGGGGTTAATATTKQNWQPPRHYFAKGTYFRLAGKKPSFQHLIYPVPDPKGAGLGVHATIDWNKSSIKFGPDVEWIDSTILHSEDIDLNPNIQRGDKFYDAVRSYWPDLQDGQLVPDYVGIRPKLNHPSQLLVSSSGAKGGKEEEGETTTTTTTTKSLGFKDFSIVGSKEHGIPGLVHLFGIESPGLTSSMAIADYVRDMVLLEDSSY